MSDRTEQCVAVTLTLGETALVRHALHEAEQSMAFDQEQIDRMRSVQSRVAAARHDEAEAVTELPPVERLQAVAVEPGDTIIASVSVGCQQYVIEGVYERLSWEFPENRVLVFAGVELWVGRSPQGNETETE